MKYFLLNQAKDLIRWGYRRNYDWMLFLTSPMVLSGSNSWLPVY